MSYSFKIKAEGNRLTVESRTTDVPDGTWDVQGHEEANWLSIGVTRHNAENRQVAQATSYARRTDE